MIPLGILQCGDAPVPVQDIAGDYPDHFATLLAPFAFRQTVWRVHDGALPPGPGAAAAWLVTGSRHGVYEEHAWLPPLQTLLRAIVAAQVPLVGICFGHQVIAQALGGRVEKFSGGWAVGRRAYDWQGRTVHLNAWHQDQVTLPPPGAVTLARNDFTRHAALSCGDRTLTIQPHPEFGADIVAALIAARGDVVPAALLDQARAGLERPVDRDFVAGRMAKILTR